MLLPAHVNGAGDKGSKALDVWLEDRDDDFLELHLIPKDKSLWAPNKFEEFIEQRKKLILNKFKQMDLLNDDGQ